MNEREQHRDRVRALVEQIAEEDAEIMRRLAQHDSEAADDEVTAAAPDVIAASADLLDRLKDRLAATRWRAAGTRRRRPPACPGP